MARFENMWGWLNTSLSGNEYGKGLFGLFAWPFCLVFFVRLFFFACIQAKKSETKGEDSILQRRLRMIFALRCVPSNKWFLNMPGHEMQHARLVIET